MQAGFRISIGADIAEVARVIAAFGDFADAEGLPASVRRSAFVVLDELLANTVSHGLQGRPEGQVTIDVKLATELLVMTLRDNGNAFDPFARAAPDTTSSVEDRPIGGLGIHLVKQLVDDVSYRREGDHNVVVIAKRLAGDETADHLGGRAMDINTRTQGDVSIVAITGNLDSITSPKAQQAIDALIASGARKIGMDFSALDYISSAGLRVMLGTAKKLTAAGGALRTFGLNSSVREVFDISGFSTILQVFANEADAMKGF